MTMGPPRAELDGRVAQGRAGSRNLSMSESPSRGVLAQSRSRRSGSNAKKREERRRHCPSSPGMYLLLLPDIFVPLCLSCLSASRSCPHSEQHLNYHEWRGTRMNLEI